ncbi:MAG: hypothetical protein WCW47_02110 [Candidatus Paceibacterota bacterium]
MSSIVSIFVEWFDVVIPSTTFSFGYDGILSTKTDVTFSFFILPFKLFFGNVIFKDKRISIIPDTIIKVVLQELGTPKNGIIKIKMPRKNVLLRFIIKALYIRAWF